MKKRNFTLIELLTVIAIIAILAALLLPTLQMARNHFTGLACVGKQRQISLAMRSYAADNNNHLPRSSSYVDAYYRTLLENYIDAKGDAYSKVYSCPDKSTGISEIGGTIGNLGRASRSINRMKNPSTMAVLVDYREGNLNSAYAFQNRIFYQYIPGAMKYVKAHGLDVADPKIWNEQEFSRGRHGGKVGVAFVDGGASLVDSYIAARDYHVSGRNQAADSIFRDVSY